MRKLPHSVNGQHSVAGSLLRELNAKLHTDECQEYSSQSAHEHLKAAVCPLDRSRSTYVQLTGSTAFAQIPL